MRELIIKTENETVNMIAQKLLNELETKLIDKYKYFKNREKELTDGALIFIAYKKAGIPRTLDEMSMELKDYELGIYLSSSNLYKRYKKIKEILGMELCETATLVSSHCITATKPEQLIERYGKNLKLKDTTIKSAMDMSDKIKNRSGSSPQTIAGACLFLASNLNDDLTTQREIADFMNISEVTVRSNYLKLLKELDKVNHWGKKREQEIKGIFKNRDSTTIHEHQKRRMENAENTI